MLMYICSIGIIFLIGLLLLFLIMKYDEIQKNEFDKKLIDMNLRAKKLLEQELEQERAANELMFQQEQILQHQMHFLKWLDEKFHYTSEDILYYFSKFTDEYEYEYLVERSLSFYESLSEPFYQNPNRDSNQVFYFVFSSQPQTIYDNQVDNHGKYLFNKPDKCLISNIINKNNTQIESLTQFNKELRSFNTCLNQFKIEEENIIDIEVDICSQKWVESTRSLIIVKFKKSIPTSVIDQYKSLYGIIPNF